MGITDIPDIPILSMLRTRLDSSQARQRILADNVQTPIHSIFGTAMSRR